VVRDLLGLLGASKKKKSQDVGCKEKLLTSVSSHEVHGESPRESWIKHDKTWSNNLKHGTSKTCKMSMNIRTIEKYDATTGTKFCLHQILEGRRAVKFERRESLGIPRFGPKVTTGLCI
jgi:hypothetical protein